MRLLWLLASCILLAVCQEDDPYFTLGLTRKASQKDIKSAYKAMAKEWHPDKNQSPDASKKFMEISNAYEVLSDPQKKERYDKFGTFDEPPGTRGGFGGRHNFDSFFGYGGFGGYEDGYFREHKISLKEYTHKILERSNSQPYIIYAYSNYCQLCFRYQNVWKAAVQDLEPLGYGIATVNANTNGDLLEKLRVTQLPAILAVVEGRVMPMRHNMMHLTDKAIRQFAQKVIPDYYITRISTRQALSRFIEQWKPTNKVSFVALGSAAEPRARYLLAAMKYSQFARFAYVSLTEPTDEMTALRESVDIKCTQCENILVYSDLEHDDAIDRLSISHASQLKKETLEEFIEKHKVLNLPRLSSTTILDTICPISPRTPRQLCVILPVLTGSTENEHVDAFRHYVIDNNELWKTRKVNFAYVYADKQIEWMKPFMEKRKGELKDSARDLLVFWRMDYTKAKFTWLEGAWTGRKEETNDKIMDVVEQRKKLEETGRINNMVDEYGLTWFTKWSRAISRTVETAWHHMTHEETYIILSALGTLALILGIGWALSYFNERDNEPKKRKFKANDVGDVNTEGEWHPDDPKIKKDQESNASKVVNKQNRIMSIMRPLLHELRAETYFGMIRLLKPGCRSMILLVDEESKEQLLRRFAQDVFPLRNNKTFSFGYLVVPKNLDWFRKLLEHTLPTEEKPAGDVDLSASMYKRLKLINHHHCIGTVLTLCGWKLYFSIYHPKHVELSRRNFIDTDDDGTSSGEDQSYRSDEFASMGEKKKLHRTSSQRMVNVENVMDGFPNWMDRLLEGSIRRYYIPEWPDNLK